MAVLGLLAEQPLKAESLQAERPHPHRHGGAGAGPAGRGAESGDDGLPLRAVAAYYAPQGDFSLSGRFVKPPAELAVTANVLLIVEDGGLHAHGGWAMLPRRGETLHLRFHPPRRLADRQPSPQRDKQAAGLRVLRRRRPGPPRPRPLAAGNSRRGRSIGPISTPCGRRRAGWPIGRRRSSNSPPFPSSAPRTTRGPWWWRPATTSPSARKRSSASCRWTKPRWASTAWTGIAPSLAYRYDKSALRGGAGGPADRTAADRPDGLLLPRHSRGAHGPRRVGLPRRRGAACGGWRWSCPATRPRP